MQFNRLIGLKSVRGRKFSIALFVLALLFLVSALLYHLNAKDISVKTANINDQKSDFIEVVSAAFKHSVLIYDHIGICENSLKGCLAKSPLDLSATDNNQISVLSSTSTAHSTFFKAMSVGSTHSNDTPGCSYVEIRDGERFNAGWLLVDGEKRQVLVRSCLIRVIKKYWLK